MLHLQRQSSELATKDSARSARKPAAQILASAGMTLFSKVEAMLASTGQEGSELTTAHKKS
jgi:hypothetical protein